MERGKHPFPSRTRKLSPSSPMVLHGRPCGRVGRCRSQFRIPPRRMHTVSPPRALEALGGSFFSRPARTSWGNGTGGSRRMSKPYDPKDAYYRKARQAGLRARSAFKIEEIARRFRLYRPGMAILDLGAAPGGWLQILARLV